MIEVNVFHSHNLSFVILVYRDSHVVLSYDSLIIRQPAS
jgi:hypothetical protein